MVSHAHKAVAEPKGAFSVPHSQPKDQKLGNHGLHSFLMPIQSPVRGRTSLSTVHLSAACQPMASRPQLPRFSLYCLCSTCYPQTSSASHELLLIQCVSSTVRESTAAEASVPRAHMIISFLGLFLKTDLFHEYECFACIHTCAPHVCLVLVEARRGASDPLELGCLSYTGH